MAIGAEARKQRAVGIETVEPPSLADAKSKAQPANGPAKDKIGAKGVPREHAFDLEHVDQRGRLWTGHFECHALNFMEVARVGLTRARLSGGVSPGSLDVVTLHMLEMLAHLAIAVDKAPPWAAKLDEVMDPGVVSAIYEEVADHANRFRGTAAEGPGEAPGEGSGDDDGASLAAQDG